MADPPLEDSKRWNRGTTAPLGGRGAAARHRVAALPGAVAIVLGGSRAVGTQRPESDWDLPVSYCSSERAGRADDVRALGHAGYVSELGEWGPIVNGGAWLTIEGTPVDILFRDLDTVERWLGEAEHGRFEVLTQNGYIVGAPTYPPVGELAVKGRSRESCPAPAFPSGSRQPRPGAGWVAPRRR